MKIKKFVSAIASVMLILSAGISLSAYAENGYGDIIDAAGEYDVNYDDEIMPLDIDESDYDILTDETEEEIDIFANGDAALYSITEEDSYDIESYETSSKSSEPDTVTSFIVCLVIGIITAAVIVGSMKSKMKTVRKNTRATDYQKRDSFVLERREDAFLYKKIEKTAIPRSNTAQNNK